jgi:hypothetical protein
MFVRELAMFFSGCGMVLGLIVLTARVVVLGLMMVMRGRMVVAGRGVMMLLRRMFCHFSVLRRSDLGRPMSTARHSHLKTRNALRFRPIRGN